ncbi:hypothetical protein CHUAL_009626, partial [Chamberlinius hualienensis]
MILKLKKIHPSSSSLKKIIEIIYQATTFHRQMIHQYLQFLKGPGRPSFQLTGTIGRPKKIYKQVPSLEDAPIEDVSSSLPESPAELIDEIANLTEISITEALQ